MQLDIYSKLKKGSDGRSFRIYLSRLTRKSDGEQIPVRVCFQEGQALPTSFPCTILVEKSDANLSDKTYTTSDGETRKSYTLWVDKYEPGPPFEDHSLDDYE